jgi:hypothetical protein
MSGNILRFLDEVAEFPLASTSLFLEIRTAPLQSLANFLLNSFDLIESLRVKN